MPFAMHDDVRIYWKLEGTEGATPLVLLNSIGTEMAMWDRAMPFLLDHFLTLRIDTRGHGASDTPSGDYGLELLAQDVFAVMDHAGIEQAPIAGVSLGGMIAMQAALMEPERVNGLGLICTTATTRPQMWDDRIAKVRAEGMTSIADVVMARFLTPDFATFRPHYADTIRRSLIFTPASGYSGCGAAIRDMALAERLPEIAARTLVVVGTTDISTPLAGNGDLLLSRIPEAKLAEVPAAHIAPIEAPEEVAEALRAFFA